MDLNHDRLDHLPEGEEIDCSPKPVLTKSHAARLRTLWSLGRPMHVGDLGGIDLDLVVHGFAEPVAKGYGSGAVLSVTKRGISHLNEVRQALIAAQRPHHELGHRLARHLQAKGLHTWENVEFSNPDWSQPRSWGVVRPDVFACLPVLKAETAAPAIYEVKVSRADFLADLTRPEKRGAYSQLAEAVYFCCPDGLLSKAEVPDGYGLVVEVSQDNFVLKKKARRQKGFVMAVNTAMTLMVKRQMPLVGLE